MTPKITLLGDIMSRKTYVNAVTWPPYVPHNTRLSAKTWVYIYMIYFYDVFQIPAIHLLLTKHFLKSSFLINVSVICFLFVILPLSFSIHNHRMEFILRRKSYICLNEHCRQGEKLRTHFSVYQIVKQKAFELTQINKAQQIYQFYYFSN